MLTIESRIGSIKASDESVFKRVSDFRQLKSQISNKDVSEIIATEDHCQFTIKGIGEMGLKIIEKQAPALVKIANDESVPFQFNLWIQLKPAELNETRVRITLKADLNPFMAMAAKKPLTQFVESMVYKMEKTVY